MSLLLELPGVPPHAAREAVLAALATADAGGSTGCDLATLAAAAATTPEDVAAALAPLIGDGRPMVRIGSWITSRRAWDHETRLAALLTDGATGSPIDAACEADLQRILAGGDQRQQAAARIALSRRVSLITGGPGRGKTWVAGAIVAAAAARQARAGGPPLTIALAAPTGKAAARLKTSISQSLAGEAAGGHLTVAEAERLGSWVTTLHGLFHDRRASTIDLLLVDEVSMASAAVLRRALEGLPAHARIVLLGDPDQLASVDPGRVLGDLVDLPAAHPLSAATVRLLVNHRSAGTPVAVLADACQAGDPLPAFQDRTAADHQDAWAVRCDPPDDIIARLADHGSAVIRAVTTSDDPAVSLARLGDWLVLTTLRDGRWGSQGITAAIEDRLARDGLIEPDRDGHYQGRPILITRNQDDAGLHNGDLGVLWPQADGGWDLVLGEDQGLRRLPITRCGSWEAAWAMTIHKSQGSQARQVEILGPGPGLADHPLLTRELLYTGVTRARERVRLWMTATQVERAAHTATRRSSGLGLALRRLAGG